MAKKKVRRVSVLIIQKLPPEKVVELLEQVNEGKVVLVSIYRDRWEQIGVESKRLRRFARAWQGVKVGATTKLMRKLSRRWSYEDEERLPSPQKQLDKEGVPSSSPPGFHSAKVL